MILIRATYLIHSAIYIDSKESTNSDMNVFCDTKLNGQENPKKCPESSLLGDNLPGSNAKVLLKNTIYVSIQH